MRASVAHAGVTFDPGLWRVGGHVRSGETAFSSLLGSDTPNATQRSPLRVGKQRKRSNNCLPVPTQYRMGQSSSYMKPQALSRPIGLHPQRLPDRILVTPTRTCCHILHLSQDHVVCRISTIFRVPFRLRPKCIVDSILCVAGVPTRF